MLARTPPSLTRDGSPIDDDVVFAWVDECRERPDKLPVDLNPPFFDEALADAARRNPCIRKDSLEANPGSSPVTAEPWLLGRLHAKVYPG